MPNDFSTQDGFVNLTLPQSVGVGLTSGFSSSLINHPFQVLRARFQNAVEMSKTHPERPRPVIFTADPRVLFRGFPATLLSMWSLTVTQALSKHTFGSKVKEGTLLGLLPATLGGFLSAGFTAPLEGAIIRQSKTKGTGDVVKESTYQSVRNFHAEYGVRRSYSGGILIGIRTATVGSAFSYWTPLFASYLELHTRLSGSSSSLVASVFIGTCFAALSQPPESLRIEQQFTADEKKPLTIREAASKLYRENGVRGLFKGGAYRIPRTAPGIVINSLVYKRMTEYFEESNKVFSP